MKEIYSNIVDIERRRIFPGKLVLDGECIYSIEETGGTFDNYILPGFVDAHVHIESSMVTPLEFSKVAIRHGTVGVVSDPHEIANVLGEAGVHFMVENSRITPMKCMLGVPSCVPATNFESSGAEIGPAEIQRLFELPEINLLSEMMNFPGVIAKDPSITRKIEMSRQRGYPVDGHAPGLRGESLDAYLAAGISTDHECNSIEEATEKVEKGMKILIREGSAAKNFNELIPLIKKYADRIMFCSDDLHPDDLLLGHINLLVKRAMKMGYDLFDVLRAASYNTVKHYNLEIGLLQEKDPADFIIVDNLEEFNVLGTFINGKEYIHENQIGSLTIRHSHINKFECGEIDTSLLEIEAIGNRIKVIAARDGDLFTKQSIADAHIENGKVCSDVHADVLKIAVINRYKNTEFLKPGMGFVRGFNLKKGAFASSIAHDSHNIICVGTNDQVMMETINWIIKGKGGIAVHDGISVTGLTLEVAGLVTNENVNYAAKMYRELSDTVKQCGCELESPFMTLSFMALLVIPELKLSDMGLFDGNSFEFTSLFENE